MSEHINEFGERVKTHVNELSERVKIHASEAGQQIGVVGGRVSEGINRVPTWWQSILCRIPGRNCEANA